MSYACFMCKRCFTAEFSFKQHLIDVHNWESEIEDLNERFLRCPYCSERSRHFDEHLHHVLSSCPYADLNVLYRNRHDKVLKVIYEAVTDHYRHDRDWNILSVLDDSYYVLPLGIRNEPGACSPDILAYCTKKKEAVIIELTVSWETNMPRARRDAHGRMDVWSHQFEEHGYHCFCYNVEVGARGMVSNSFYDCLEQLTIDEYEISRYAQRCADTAVAYSQKILQGEP